MATSTEINSELVVDVDTFYNPANVSSDLGGFSEVDTVISSAMVVPNLSELKLSPVIPKECEVSGDKSDANGKQQIEKTSGIEETDSSMSSSLSISPKPNGASIPIHLRDYDDLLVDVSNDSSYPNSLQVDDFTNSPLLKQTNDQYDVKVSNEEASDVTIKNVIDISRSITHSTLSLNMCSIQDDESFANDTLSKSEEHISSSNIIKFPEKHEAQTTNEINREEILSQFQNQKHKVSATQKINSVSDQSHINLDIKYSRLPKEILSQDLGSIVKNVHGIFSSVSGSLKNAYNQSQKVTLPKSPIKQIDPPITNRKLMNEIFEEKIDDAAVHSVNVTLVPESTNSKEVDDANKSDNVKKFVDINNMERLEAAPKTDVVRLQIETLERLLSDQRKENGLLKEKMQQQNDKLIEKELLFKDLENKMDLISKRMEQAEREKDAAVMRYAGVECAAIESKRAAERAERAERAAQAELELMNNKLKSAHSEKQRIIQLYDDKCHEVQTGERELSRVREEMRELEGRLKWTQSKLRLEIDANKENVGRGATQAEAAAEAARRSQFESELKETQAALILCRHEKEELSRQLSSLSNQYDTCRRERDEHNTALHAAREELESLRESNSRLEAEAAELAALRAQAALASTLSTQLQSESERRAAAEQALARERARADTCAIREASALEHVATLTSQHVASQARAHDADTKARALSLDNTALRDRVSTMETECSCLRTALTEETERRNKESRALARKVAELTEQLAEANKRLEWERGEIGVLKTRHTQALKELNRELQRALRRCEQLEAKQLEAQSQRTGSVSSVSSGETPPEDALTNGHAQTLPDVQTQLPDRQTLIERIVSLQRALARRAERVEFLEEHCATLTSELRNKTRLLRGLLPALPAGALASPTTDQHKKELAALSDAGGGGVMAALWGSGGGGETVTLELSLEMNRRLQAVLEDALLKNITLKENMDTLGEEIARLKGQKNSKVDK